MSQPDTKAAPLAPPDLSDFHDPTPRREEKPARPDAVFTSTAQRNFLEMTEGGIRLAGAGLEAILPVLKRQGAKVLSRGTGFFGRDNLWPDDPKRMWGVMAPFAFVRLPKGWYAKRAGPESAETVITDDKGHARLEAREFYGGPATGADPFVTMELKHRFNVMAAPKGDIILHDGLTAHHVRLKEIPAGTIDTGARQDAVRHGLYKALLRGNPLSRAFTGMGHDLGDGVRLAPLWDRDEPLTKKDVERIGKYARKYMAKKYGL